MLNPPGTQSVLSDRLNIYIRTQYNVYIPANVDEADYIITGISLAREILVSFFL